MPTCVSQICLYTNQTMLHELDALQLMLSEPPTAFWLTKATLSVEHSTFALDSTGALFPQYCAESWCSASGSVVSNVVGTKTPRFCLFGSTVNAASRYDDAKTSWYALCFTWNHRMESNSETNRIHVSEEAAKLIEHQEPSMKLEKRVPSIHLKGLGTLTTYWLPYEAEDHPAANGTRCVSFVSLALIDIFSSPLLLAKAKHPRLSHSRMVPHTMTSLVSILTSYWILRTTCPSQQSSHFLEFLIINWFFEEPMFDACHDLKHDVDYLKCAD